MKTLIFGEADEKTLAQIERCTAAEEGSIGVLCADNHLGYSMPIGGVVAYRNFVSPSGVGFDIACGNMAVRTPLQASDVDIPAVMAQIAKDVSFGMGRANNERVADAPVFESIAKSPVAGQRKLLQTAMAQLGTVGSGNHYVDIFEEVGTGLLWIGVHFGSRGFGHKTASGFLALAQGKTFDDHPSEGGMDAPPVLIDINTPTGQDYIEAMSIAGEYAYAGREWVVNKVLDILWTKADVWVHNHHNFAWLEEHNGEKFWVHRKGATPARPGQLGFIGGSMGGIDTEPDLSVIIQGRETLLSELALYSTVHGAGRVMSRTQAAGKVKITKVWRCGTRDCPFPPAPARDFQRGKDNSLPVCHLCGGKLRRWEDRQKVREGLVDWEAVRKRLVQQGVYLLGGGADEAPEAYKRLESVLAAHGNTIEILHRLRPIGVAMAGADVFDPYKD